MHETNGDEEVGVAGVDGNAAKSPVSTNSLASGSSVSNWRQSNLQAWTMSAVPVDTGGSIGCSCQIEPLPIPQDQIKARLERQQKQPPSVVDCLESLNLHQRSMVLDHVRREQLNLLFVERLQSMKLTTVFGELDIAVLFWITEPSASQGLMTIFITSRNRFQ